MSDDVDTAAKPESWRTRVRRLDEGEVEDLIDRIAPPRPMYRESPVEAYYLEPSCTVYPGAPRVDLVLSPEYDEANRRNYVQQVTTGRDLDASPKRGQIHGLSKRARRRAGQQARTLIAAECVDQSVAVTLRFPTGAVTDGKEAQKRFQALFVSLERWAQSRDAKVGGLRSYEKAKNEATIHVHAWLWISRAELLPDLASEIQKRWPPRAGFRRAHANVAKTDPVLTEKFLWGTIEYVMKMEGKSEITGVLPVAFLRKHHLPFAKPQKIEVDVPQAQWIKREANKQMNRGNFPEPRRMVFNLPEPERTDLLRDSYQARRGPTPAEVFDLKVGEALDETIRIQMQEDAAASDLLEDVTEVVAYDYGPPDE